jgi:hypothetical protein
LALLLGSSEAAAEPVPAELSQLLFVSSDEAEAAWLPQRSSPYRMPSERPEGMRLLSPKGPAKGELLARVGLQALAPGHYVIDFGSALLRVDAIEARALDHSGAVIDATRSHASLSRVLPAGLGSGQERDRDALSYLLIGPAGASIDAVEVLSRGADGRPLDAIPQLRAEPVECPAGTAPELVCRKTRAVRAVADLLDRGHPLARENSIRAEVGGSLRLSFAGRKAVELRVGGPRETRFGPIERLHAKLRVLVLRAERGGAPAIGGNDAGARALASDEVMAAAAIWGQCGIEFGSRSQLSIQIVDPPPTRLLALGCGFGMLATGGGKIRFKAGGRTFSVATRAGDPPIAVALRLQAELAAAGQVAHVFENQLASNEALPTADLMLGSGVLEADGALSSDPTLAACLGQVELGDGLTHFSDGDAFAGTVEERALLRAFDDGNPSSIEVLIIPAFARSSRIGESFMLQAGSSLSNAVIIDRAAIRAGARSFALAHELGHVLLAMPGHPDDFGVDRPGSLMDADVADPTLFGPRRLSIGECERAYIESGMSAPVPLLTPVKLEALPPLVTGAR